LDQGEGQGVVGPGPDVGKPPGTIYQAVRVLNNNVRIIRKIFTWTKGILAHVGQKKPELPQAFVGTGGLLR